MKDYAVRYDERLFNYVNELFHPNDQVLEEVRERSEREGLPAIHVGPMDGLHLEVLTRLCGAKKIVEIGTLAGYSGICLLKGAGPEGHLDTFDINPKNSAVALESFRKAGVVHQVTSYVGPALDMLKEIEKTGPFDLVFVDADKPNYPNYYNWAEKHLKVGGVLIGDNTFAFGKLAENPQGREPEEVLTIQGMQYFNKAMVSSGKFRSTIFPTGEGLTVGIKVRP